MALLCLITWLKAYHDTILVICMQGDLLGFFRESLGLESPCVFSTRGVNSASDRPRGGGVGTYKEQAAQHKAHGTPGTRQHVQGNQPLRPFPALLFCESIKFLGIVADYFHFAVELSDTA